MVVERYIHQRGRTEVNGGHEAQALRRRQEELNNIRVDQTYRDTNGHWCCALSVICPDGSIKSILFAWDASTQKVERLDEEGPMPGGLFITARNVAKDTIRPLL